MEWVPALLVGLGLFAVLGFAATHFSKWLSGEHTPIPGYSRARFVFSAAIIGAVSLRLLAFSPFIAVAIACLLIAALTMAFTTARKE
jgi:hypothetical protein